jgi:hypothetical protein
MLVYGQILFIGRFSKRSDQWAIGSIKKSSRLARFLNICVETNIIIQHTGSARTKKGPSASAYRHENIRKPDLLWLQIKQCG